MAGRLSPWCDRCGVPTRFVGDMSCIGICPDCGEFALVDNLRGMVDKESVPYKRWLVAHQMSRMGRPGKYTPRRAELIAILSLHPKKSVPDVACANEDGMPTLE